MLEQYIPEPEVEVVEIKHSKAQKTPSVVIEGEERQLTTEEYNQVLTAILSTPALSSFIRSLIPDKKIELKRLNADQVKDLLDFKNVKIGVPDFKTGNNVMDEHLKIETARVILIQFIVKNPWFKISLNHPYDSLKAAFHALRQVLFFNEYGEDDSFIITDKGIVELNEPQTQTDENFIA